MMFGDLSDPEETMLALRVWSAPLVERRLMMGGVGVGSASVDMAFEVACARIGRAVCDRYGGVAVERVSQSSSTKSVENTYNLHVKIESYSPVLGLSCRTGVPLKWS